MPPGGLVVGRPGLGRRLVGDAVGLGLSGSDGAHRATAMVGPDSAAARASSMTPLSWYPVASPLPVVVADPSRPAEGLSAGRRAFCLDRAVFPQPCLVADGDG